MQTTGNDELARWLIAAARVIHRFSTRGAIAGLAVGSLAFATLLPWLPGLGAASLPVGIALAAALVAAPLRVMWHGWAISQAYGDPDRIEAALAEVPASVDEALGRILAAAAPSTGRRGGRRVVAAWRTLRALRDALQDAQETRDQIEFLVRPLRPDAVGLTVTALWATLATLSLGVPVTLVSLVALAVT